MNRKQLIASGIVGLVLAITILFILPNLSGGPLAYFAVFALLFGIAFFAGWAFASTGDMPDDEGERNK
ncbi:MAG: hypothetical protein HC876_06605 [Chloroflexaceae bacterium]|nr:hypothetical protein [Chloroflexaceae bacterium]NJO05208.1 hypothetical protein [Chloroflexaceae bacterium]